MMWNKLLTQTTLLLGLSCCWMANSIPLFAEELIPESNVQEDTATKQSQSVMSNKRLELLIAQLDPNFKGSNGHWQLQTKNFAARVITDENADRMRILVQVGPSDTLPQELLYRVLQANFDTALDARYAIAHEILWSTFIHPLSSLGVKEFISGFAQTVTLAESFGGRYSSGALRFRGGDNEAADV